MGATMTLADFYNYVRDNRKRMADIYREIEEIQFQFNDLHTRLLDQRHELVSSYVQLLLDSPKDTPPELVRLLQQQETVERKAIQEETSALQSQAAEKRQKADDFIQQAQRQVVALREENPILNQQEEGLKSRLASLESDIQRLDGEIRQLGRFPIGWLTQAGKRRRLQKQRAQLAENRVSVATGIRTVREKWQAEKKTVQDSQANLQAQWQTFSVESSQLQARADYLAANADQLSMHDAAQNVLNGMADLPPVEGPWKERLLPLIELGRNKASYETGLTSVAEILGLLKGLGEGMDRFIRSVGTVYEEQRRYNLPSLTLSLSDAVTSLHAAWPDFQSKVKDEKYLGAHPMEFSQRVQETVKQRLTEAAIQKMFEDMGDALNKATKAWK